MEKKDDLMTRLASIERMLNNQTISQKEVLTFQETCEFLQVSRSFLYKQTHNRTIPCFCPSGKLLYFRKQDLLEWMQKNPRRTKEDIDRKAIAYAIPIKGRRAS